MTTQKYNVTTLGLFEKRMAGDEGLLELARQRFLEARMGTEIHAATPEQLDYLLHFRPFEDAPAVVHLPRDFDLINELSQKQILELAARGAGQVSGMVLHDHTAMISRRDDYINAAWKLDAQLEKLNNCPTLFIEYAAGLEPADFTRFFSSILDLGAISCCIDIGHVGLRAARAAYVRKHPGEDICSLKSQPPHLPKVIEDVQASVDFGAQAAIKLVEEICALKRPLHFHLHDAHPLSTFSPFGVSDHLSFFAEIPINFEHRGRRALAPMFGPEALLKLVARTLDLVGSRPVSFTLEIHPTGERLPLDTAAAAPFEHWTDKTSAEQMNHWLAVLSRNHELLRRAIPSPSSQSATAAQTAADSETACLI
ncbi:MAG TPA: hypothetical protein VL361_07580 [Candidatus Limnocylindrales bacterium]|jgi:hypothetical protein|nr:hypothetical protein [Candidatus Limnocylindrales bacterium]